MVCHATGKAPRVVEVHDGGEGAVLMMELDVEGESPHSPAPGSAPKHNPLLRACHHV